jgi:hypothetical protein
MDPEMETFLGREMATSAASAIWVQKSLYLLFIKEKKDLLPGLFWLFEMDILGCNACYLVLPDGFH